jgi:hypothetical protein
MTATLWIPGTFPGLNELIESAKGHGGSGGGYSSMKLAWTNRAWGEALSARLPRLPGPVSIDFTWIEKNQRRDPDNVAAGGRKLILDGLVKAGVLQGDGWKIIQSWTDRFQVSKERPGVGLIIHDRSMQIG